MKAETALKKIAQKEVAGRASYGDSMDLKTIVDYLDREANDGNGLEYFTPASLGGEVRHQFFPTTEQIREAVEWALKQPIDTDILF